MLKLDMNQFKIDASKGLPLDEPPSIDYYDNEAIHSSFPCANVVAKRLNGDSPQHYVAEAQDGSFFNPINMTIRHLHNYKFRPVNKKRFDFYLKFLKTGELGHLRAAERTSTGD